MKTDNRDPDVTRRTHTFEYQITVSNISDADIHDLKVTDKVPSHFTILRITSGGRTEGQTVIWENVELKRQGEDGSEKVFRIEVGVNPNAPITEICNEAVADTRDHDRTKESRSCINVKELPKVAATIAPTPVTPVGVPITAPTGAGTAAALATSLLGTGSLAFVLKKFW